MRDCKCSGGSIDKMEKEHKKKGVPSTQKYQTLQARNPHKMSGKSKGITSSVEPSEMSAKKLLNVISAKNPYKMNGKGSFGKVNLKSPNKTPASTYVRKNLVK